MNRIFWLDLETTGLEPMHDYILELAIAEATLEDPFNLKWERSFVLNYEPHWWTDVDPYVKNMHTKNGLAVECAASSMPCYYVETILMELIPDWKTKEDKPILAGSSVHFDAAFLGELMPAFYSQFSHRHYDVSAIKLFCQSLGMEKLPKAEAHRALPDIHESIEHAKKCCEWLGVWPESMSDIRSHALMKINGL